MSFPAAAVAGCVLLPGCILLWLSHSAAACMETAWSDGYLSHDTAVHTVTLADPRGTSCTCCALCHQNSACASFSFKADTRECLLYGVIASYSTLEPDESWQYFVMPGRSQHHQFCREDSDCQQEGDFCRGRVCTALTAVTCRVIYETFGAASKYGHWPIMHAWIGNQPLSVACRMTPHMPGFTRLFENARGFPFTRANVGWYMRTWYTNSILDLAEDIRQLRDDPTYQLFIWGGAGNNRKGVFVEFDSVPRSEPVLSSVPRDTPVGKVSESIADPLLTSVAMPYRPADGDDLLLVKVTTTLSSSDTQRSLARTDGQLWEGLLDYVVIYIRE